jgi:uncharacterized protein (DUF433 family)
MLSALMPGQAVLVESLNLEAVARDTEERASRLVERGPHELGTIVSNRYVFGNQPVIAGTRIPSAAVWEFHKAGYSLEEIVQEYPRLTRCDVESAIHFEEQRRQPELAG